MTGFTCFSNCKLDICQIKVAKVYEEPQAKKKTGE
jgi:hypothetical protein